MTERVLPAVSIPVPVRPGIANRTARAPREVAVTRPAVGHKRDTFLTTPARAGMLLGGTAAIYAVTLAGVAALQSSSDAALSASRQPYVDTVAAARAQNDQLEQTLAQANADAKWLAGVYDEMSTEVSGYQSRLDSLAQLVADVEGSAAALPTRISLPKVTMRGSSGGSTTRSSGGSSSSGSSSSSTSGGSGG